MASGLRVPVYEKQTQFVGPYRAPTASAEAMGSATAKGLTALGEGITDVGTAMMQRSAQRQKMEDMNFEQAETLKNNKDTYEDFLANRNTAISGAESFSETSAARWAKIREANRKSLLTEGGYRPSQAALDRSARNSERQAQEYEFRAIDYEHQARTKKAFDDSTRNIEQMQAAAAEYGTLDTTSAQMETALETAKLTLPPEQFAQLEKAAHAGMANTVTAYLNRLQDQAVGAGSNEERQAFETEAFAHLDAAIARGYMDPAEGVEAKRMWKENYQKRAITTLDPTERQRIGLNMTTGGNIREQLFQRESGGNYGNDANPQGYAGGYQFGAPLLTTLGLYTPGAGENLDAWSRTGKNAPGKWSGTFSIPGFPDVRTKQDFLKNPAAQEKAWEIHDAQMNKEIVDRGMEPFIGQTIDGIPITPDGLKAAMHLGGAEGVEKFLKTATPMGGVTPQPAVRGQVIEAQAGTRNKPLNARTRDMLSAAAGATGVKVRVKSGAQPSSGPDRTGSHRHNIEIGSADIELIDQSGKVLSSEVPEDRARITAFLKAAKASGATGFGAGLDYMGPTTLHVGFGSSAVWGAGGKSDNAPQWLREALIGAPQGGGLQSSRNPADNNGTNMTSYLRMGSNAPSYFDSMPQDQMIAQMNQANVDLAQLAASNARQWAEVMAVRKGEISLAIATGDLTDGETILADDILEPSDKAELYKSFQSGREEGSALRANMDAYSNGQFHVNPFDPKQTTQGQAVLNELLKGATDPVSQKAIEGKYVGDTDHVPGSIMAGLQNGLAADTPATIETAMTDAERLIGKSPRSFAASEDGRAIRDSAAEWRALQGNRGMSPREAAQAMITRRDIEMKVDDTTREAADRLVKAQSETMSTLTRAVGVEGDLGPDPTFAPDQQLAFQADALEIYREKLLTTAKMDPAIAHEQTVAEMKTLWGRTPVTGEARVMRFPPEALYPAIAGSHDYVERSFNHFRAFENVPEDATDVQLISSPFTAQDKRNNSPARYMVGWFEYKDTGQRIWNMSPNFFYVGREEQDNAVAVDAAQRASRFRGEREPQEEIADIMKLPPDQRAAELNRRRFGGNRQDYIDEARRIEALNRPGRSLEERDAAAAARGAGAPADPTRQAQIQQQEIPGPATAPVQGEAEVPDTSPPAAEGVVPDIELRPGVVGQGERAALTAGLGKKAANRLLAGGNWETVVEGLIEHSQIDGSSDLAAERRAAHDMQLQALGIDPRSERRATPGNMASLQRGIVELTKRMQKAGIPQETQDAVVQRVRDTASAMMQGRGKRIGPGERAETPFAEPLGSVPSSDVASHMRGVPGEKTAFQRIKSFVPVNARTFVETLFGSKADITEADFNDEDKSAILSAVQTAHNESGEKEGIIGYGMYGAEGQTADWSRFGLYTKGAPIDVIVMDSFTDPRFRLETTLGMARYKINDDGSVTITDTYNFNATRGQAEKSVAEAGGKPQALLKAFHEHGTTGLLNAIGNLAADTEDEAGRKVRIRLGKLPARRR